LVVLEQLRQSQQVDSNLRPRSEAVAPV